LAIVTSCIFFPRSSCSIIGAFWLFSGSFCTHAYGHRRMSKGPISSLHGNFYSVLFVSWPWTFFICLVYAAGFVVSDPFINRRRCWSIFSDPCFVVPIAPIPSCFDGRSATFLGFYYITLVVPEMMNLTVKSSRAGPCYSTSRSLYSTLVFELFHTTYIPLIYASGYIFSFLSLQPIPSPLTLLRWLCI